MKRNPILFFLLLAFPLSWYPWILALIHGKQSGPNPLGPLVAAIVVSAFTAGWSGVKSLLARIIRWRVGIQWYAIVFLIPLFAVVAAAFITELINAPQQSASKLAGWRDVVDRFIFIFLFIGLGEESGWRGFLLEKLQGKRTAIASSFIIIPIWAIWHLPLFGSEIGVPLLIPFLIGLSSATFLSTWIYNRTNGSVLLVMLFHTTVNTIGAGWIFPLFQGSALIMLWWVYAIIWAIVAIGVVVIVGIEPKNRAVASPAAAPAKA
jgi:CAAX amino terminal protease family.